MGDRTASDGPIPHAFLPDVTEDHTQAHTSADAIVPTYGLRHFEARQEAPHTRPGTPPSDAAQAALNHRLLHGPPPLQTPDENLYHVLGQMEDGALRDVRIRIMVPSSRRHRRRHAPPREQQVVGLKRAHATPRTSGLTTTAGAPSDGGGGSGGGGLSSRVRGHYGSSEDVASALDTKRYAPRRRLR